MASIRVSATSGGGMSERGEDSDVVEVKGIADTHGPADGRDDSQQRHPRGWEREAEEREFRMGLPTSSRRTPTPSSTSSSTR